MEKHQARTRVDRTQATERIWNQSLTEIKDLAKNSDLRTRLLPISEKAKAIEYALQKYDVVSIEAPPGAGKSIDIGKIVMDAIPGGRIAMTQPRRDAAEGVCLATAARHDLEFGKDVCFSTSEFHGNTRSTRLQIQTTGILLNQFRDNPRLDQYDVVIVDEAHERSLDIDLVIGLLKHANVLRREANMRTIKIVVASATLEQKKFKEFFDISPEATIQSRGKMFEVERRHVVQNKKFKKDQYTGEERELPYTSIAVEEVLDILRTTKQGDVLVFMPGKREIEAVRNGVESALSGNGVGRNDIQVLTLHGENKQQERSYVLKGKRQGDTKRRVIISTNIAETSVTVPDIVYVVDSCRKKEVIFDPKTGLEVLTEVPASKAECEQRAGRAGRLSKGVVRRLVTEAEFAELPDHPEPEIKRLNLSHMVLRMMSLGIKNVETFEFVDSPPAENLKEALHMLHMLGAITADQELTKLGRRMAELPLEPRMARVVVAAEELHCVDAAVAIASLIEGRGVLRYPGRDEYANARRFLTEKRQIEIKIRALTKLVPYSADAHQKADYVQQIVLRIVELGKPEVSDDDFNYWVVPSDIQGAFSILETNGLITKERTLTQKGRQAARVPLQIPGAHQAQEQVATERIDIDERDVKDCARKQLEDKQAAIKKDITSDWMLYHRVFTRFRTAPNRPRFCEENGLDFDALEKGEKNYHRILRELHGYLDSEPGLVDDQALAKAILAGYAPDHLIMQTQNRHGVEFTQVDRGDSSVRLNSGSVAFNNKPDLAVCLSLEKGRGTKIERRGVPIQTEFKYAVGVHPVGSDVLHQAIPHLVRRNEKASDYTIDDKGRVLTTYGYDFRQKNGSWTTLPKDRLLEYSEQAVLTLGRAIANQSVDAVKKETFNVEENKKVVKALQQLYARSRGDVSWKDLGTWYAERLRNTITVEEAEVLGKDHYTLRVEDICKTTEREEIESKAPEHILLDGHEYNIEYGFSPADPNSSSDEYRKDRFEVSVHLTLGDATQTYETLMKLDLSAVALARRDIKVLRADDKLTWKAKIGYKEYQNEDLIELQKETEFTYLENAFSKFKAPQVPTIDPSVERLPKLADLGVVPLPYATLHDGITVLAYPAIEVKKGNYSSDSPIFTIRYYAHDSQAKDVQAKSNKYGEELQAKADRARDRGTKLESGKTMLEDALERFHVLSERIKVMDGYESAAQQAREAAWVTSEEADTLKKYVSELTDVLQSNAGGSYSHHQYETKQDADPRIAIEILNQVERFLEEKAAIRDSVHAEVETLQPCIDAVTELMETKLKKFSDAQTEYGLSQEQYTKWKVTWDQIRLLLGLMRSSGERSHSFPDPKTAEPLLDRLEKFLAKLEPPKDLESRRELQVILEGQDRYLARIAVVEGGRVARAYSPTDPNRFEEDLTNIPIGKSGRSLHVQRNVISSSWGGTSDGFSYTLPNGTFVISRDAYKVIQVQRTPEDDAWLPLGVIESLAPAILERDRYEDRYEERVGAPPAQASKLGGFGDLIRMKEQQRSGKKNNLPQPAAPPKPAPAQAEMKKEVMTDEARKILQRDLLAAREVLEDLRTTLPNLKADGKLNDLQKKQLKLRETVVERLKDLKGVETELETTEDLARAKGISGDVVKKAQKSTEDAARIMGGQADVLQRYRKILDLIPGIERDWEGTLSPDGLKKITPKLIAIAKGVEEIDIVKKQIGEIVAEEL